MWSIGLWQAFKQFVVPPWRPVSHSCLSDYGNVTLTLGEWRTACKTQSWNFPLSFLQVKCQQKQLLLWWWLIKNPNESIFHLNYLTRLGRASSTSEWRDSLLVLSRIVETAPFWNMPCNVTSCWPVHRRPSWIQIRMGRVECLSSVGRSRCSPLAAMAGWQSLAWLGWEKTQQQRKDSRKKKRSVKLLIIKIKMRNMQLLYVFT